MSGVNSTTASLGATPFFTPVDGGKAALATGVIAGLGTTAMVASGKVPLFDAGHAGIKGVKAAAISAIIAGEIGLLHNAFEKQDGAGSAALRGAELGAVAGLTIPVVGAILEPPTGMSPKLLGRAGLWGLGGLAVGTVAGLVGGRGGESTDSPKPADGSTQC